MQCLADAIKQGVADPRFVVDSVTPLPRPDVPTIAERQGGLALELKLSGATTQASVTIASYFVQKGRELVTRTVTAASRAGASAVPPDPSVVRKSLQGMLDRLP